DEKPRHYQLQPLKKEAPIIFKSPEPIEVIIEHAPASPERSHTAEISVKENGPKSDDHFVEQPSTSDRAPKEKHAAGKSSSGTTGSSQEDQDLSHYISHIFPVLHELAGFNLSAQEQWSPMNQEDNRTDAPDHVSESLKPESHSRSWSRLRALEALFRVIIACYCGHLIGRAYAGGYDRYIQKHSTSEQFNSLRVSLKILVPSALMLGYWASIGLAMIVEYRWKLLLSWCLIYQGILTQRGYFGADIWCWIAGVTLSCFGSGMALLPSYRYQPEI
ncbi:unnamed protein product, partial [Rhizoctonia solani]